MNPENKVALITGAAHRVGKAIALRLARRGTNIILNYRSSGSAAEETKAELEALDVAVLPVQADVSDPAAIKRMVSTAIDHFGRIDILVNSAANFMETPFPQLEPEAWDLVINTNLRGPFLCARAVAPHMLKQEEGVIVNIVDLSALVPSKNMLAHSVAKSGLLALSHGLALELAPTIRVNAISPGPVISPPDYDEADNEAVARRTLLKRWGSGDNVAQAVLFLVENDYVTAELIRVDGGELIGWQEAIS